MRRSGDDLAAPFLVIESARRPKKANKKGDWFAAGTVGAQLHAVVVRAQAALHRKEVSPIEEEREGYLNELWKKQLVVCAGLPDCPGRSDRSDFHTRIETIHGGGLQQMFLLTLGVFLFSATLLVSPIRNTTTKFPQHCFNQSYSSSVALPIQSERVTGLNITACPVACTGDVQLKLCGGRSKYSECTLWRERNLFGAGPSGVLFDIPFAVKQRNALLDLSLTHLKDRTNLVVPSDIVPAFRRHVVFKCTKISPAAPACQATNAACIEISVVSPDLHALKLQRIARIAVGAVSLLTAIYFFRTLSAYNRGSAAQHRVTALLGQQLQQWRRWHVEQKIVLMMLGSDLFRASVFTNSYDLYTMYCGSYEQQSSTPSWSARVVGVATGYLLYILVSAIIAPSTIVLASSTIVLASSAPSLDALKMS
jgi:hypothetical protein